MFTSICTREALITNKTRVESMRFCIFPPTQCQSQDANSGRSPSVLAWMTKGENDSGASAV